MQTIIARREFLKTASVVAGGLALEGLASAAPPGAAGASPGLAVADLPKGSAPPPVPFPHFPDSLHAFVWRNWPLVPPERMARVAGARAADILRMGHAMGLGRPPRITREQQARSYITVIKRNWHLLPYEQLLDLLGWTPEQLAYTLREDDFLFVKLGNLKPRCPRLAWRAPAQSALEREGEMARILAQELGAAPAQAGEPLFGFIARLSRKPAGAYPDTAPGVRPSPGAAATERGGAPEYLTTAMAVDVAAPEDGRTPTSPQPVGAVSGCAEPAGPGRPLLSEDLKFCYSYFAPYGNPLLGKELDPYPEGYLAQLAQAGVNGVWLQAVLYKLAPFPWEPDLSAQHRTRLKNLQGLVARARRRGIRVFLYLNEPRAMPLRFFEGRGQAQGCG